jgi:hypothetical protein
MTDNDILNKNIDLNLNNNDMILSSYEDQQSIKSSFNHKNQSRSNNLDPTQNDTNTMKLF